MKNILLILFILLLNQLSAVAVPIRLLDAKNLKKVSVKAIGNGGHIGECITISVKNLTAVPQDIEVPPGLIFTANDSTEQNLMVVDEYSLALQPGATGTLKLFTMCIQAHDHSPQPKSLFAMNREAKGNLGALAEFIATKNYQNSTAQSAVWAITDNYAINDIYGIDTTMAGELATFVCKLTGRQREKIIPPKEHYIYSIHMNITHHFSTTTKVTLACYDSTGKVVKEYYKNRPVAAGLYIATFGINRVADKGTKFIFRITDENGNTIKERVITESINEPKAEKWKLNVSFNYILKEPIASATMSSYDDKGNLIENLYTNRSLPKGGRNQAYSFFHASGKNSVFYIRLKDETGKVIVVYKVDGSKSVKVAE